ncbi:TonB-dependent receptor [Paremcibacter congregatus]|uniref:TonB-dependent receptor n=1 Tax=Paremcibacter congregatus TaxID=2043170 RepID=A0A2G4YQZ0_9PROT|nr:TonB-dependent receptor [Paremcibacter congregatus]PHZ84735.1 hypothetical protein CRD36_10645 [Paremcibacter congregatus]QDE28929.1 TonB-dependent receptor [Paremcibacter congregatus]
MPQNIKITSLSMQMKFLSHPLRVALMAGVTLAYSPLLSLAEEAAAEGEGGVTQFEEIVVTANKREQSLRDVAMSVGVATGRDIANRGVSNLNELSISTPGLEMQELAPGFTRITIRGISPTPGTAATSGLYVDETPYVLTTSGQVDVGPDVRMFDIERVEVLRGPQGTLYGEGAMGGLVRVITNKPNLNEFEGAVQGQYYSYAHGSDGLTADAMVNLPIIENKLAVRATGYYRDDGGYIDDVYRNEPDLNDAKIAEGRISLRYQSENLTLDASIKHYDNDLGAIINSSDRNYETTFFVDTFSKDKYTIYNMTLDYDLGWANVVSSSSYFDREMAWRSDVSSVAILNIVNALYGGLTGGEPITGVITEGDWTMSAFTEELRLISNQDERLRWTAGLFYKNGQAEILTDAETIPAVPRTLFNNVVQPESEQYALFGEMEYDVTDKLHAVAGLRWFREEQRNSKRNLGDFAPVNIDINIPLTYESVQPRFSLLYDLSEDASVYGTISRGFRAGGVNSNVESVRVVPVELGGDPNVSATFNPESLWNYEIGVKGAWLDNKISANLSGFYMKWSGMQIRQNLLNPALTYLMNIGSAHSAGVELEFDVRPFTGFTASGGLQLLDAKVDEGREGFPKGDRLPNSITRKVTLRAEYEFPVTDLVSAFIRADYTNTGGSYSRVPNAEDLYSGGYDVVNMRVGVNVGQWKAELFADNIFDDFLPYEVSNPIGVGTGLPLFRSRAPRRLGVLLRVDF